jgi:hypothetical protein
VATWITFIDKWTVAANTRHAEWQAGQARTRSDVIRGSDRDRRLGELNEKFKNL